MTTSPPPPARETVQAWRLCDLVVLAMGSIAVVWIFVSHLAGITSVGANTVLVGVVASLAGIWVMAAGWTSQTDRRWRASLGVALILWGVGQALIGIEFLRGDYHAPDDGDLVSMLAAPLFLFGITRAVRSEAFSRPVLRMVIDAVMMGSSIALLVWRLGAQPGQLAGTVAAFSAGVVLVDAVIAAFGSLVFIRRPRIATGMFAMGLVGYAAADIAATLRGDPNSAMPVGALATYCVALTAFATGTRMIGPEPDDGDDLRRDLREASGAIAITALVIGGALTHLALVRRAPMAASTVFSILTISAFIVRHLVDHRQHSVTFAELRAQARTDPLTGVGNRFVLTDLPERHAGSSIGVLVIGIDGLAAVNAAFGHEEGDALIVRVARALVLELPAALAVVRLESAEFAVVIDHSENPHDVAAHVRDAADLAAHRGVESTVQVHLTAGVAAWHSGDRSVLDAVARAQRARHLATLTLGASVRLYDDDLRSRDERERLIDERLPHAIASGSIEAHYQPIIDLSTGSVVGVEALARWTDPLLGMVRPDEFVPRAEATEQIHRLGISVLEHALRTAADLGLPQRGILMSVNTSASQLRGRESGGFAQVVAAALARYDVPGESLVVEVTESMLIEQHDLAVEELRRLSTMGVQIAVDDFGTGFWALGYFRWLSADYVKIDRSLVAELADDERSGAVVASIVDLCERTGMRTIAEGVEDQRTIDVARQLGVESAQGWVYTKAVSANDLRRVIDAVELATTRNPPAPNRAAPARPRPERIPAHPAHT